jgi:hypothetical protein
MKKSPLNENETAAERISRFIDELGGWRSAVLANLRTIIREAGPELQEDWKWGTPVWSYKGNVLSAAAFANHVKLNFFRGASLPDPEKLFNAGLEAKASRAIDFHEGETIREEPLKSLIRAAMAHA